MQDRNFQALLDPILIRPVIQAWNLTIFTQILDLTLNQGVIITARDRSILTSPILSDRIVLALETVFIPVDLAGLFIVSINN